jgi:hypothetical protein
MSTRIFVTVTLAVRSVVEEQSDSRTRPCPELEEEA